MGQLYPMGAGFEALFMGDITTASDFSRIFFRILTFGIEQCEALTTIAYKVQRTSV